MNMKKSPIPLRRGALGSVLLAGSLLTAGAAYAQSAAGPVSKPSDDSLTYKGITLYGIVDIGLQYDDHSAPFNDYHPATSTNLVAKDSIKSVIGATSSNLSQSRIGLQGVEALGAGDWFGVFRVETFFNPSTGDISDALKSMAVNNGKPLTSQSTNLDSNVAGQAFAQAYTGVSSATFGSLTFGRQNTLLADGVAKYDPQGASQAFSLIGMSGTYAGGGATEDRRLDNSLRYLQVFGPVHGGLQYKFNGSSGEANTVLQADIGFEYLGASIDAYFARANSAVAAAALSAAQVAALPGLGFSVTNSLSGTISDNTTFSVMGLYNLGPAKFYAAYENLRYKNPSNPLPAGFDDIGGYKLAFVNNAAFPNDKVLNLFWAGAKYTFFNRLDVTAAYYYLHQNSYGEGANAGCAGTKAGTCSGNENVMSASADYRFTKRFDIYAGVMYSEVRGGLASGFIYNTNNYNPTIGFRWRF
jgi:predicted porin